MITFENVHKSFNGQQVLRGVDLTISKGKITVIIGPSGTGKSVLLKHIIGLLTPDTGQVRVGDVDVASLSGRQLPAFRRQFGMLFQNAALFDSLNVFDNIAFPLVEDGRISEGEIRDTVHHMLRLVGLPDVGHKMPAELSGGMRKRVGLARAIALKPSIILYDEPTTGLDPLMTDAIDKLILGMQQELPVTSIVISHDIQSTFRIADQIAMLSGGRIVEAGPPPVVRASRHEIVRRFLEGRSNAETEETVRL
ncbi:MAG: ABC transporter ATP-binding protein [Deltaproteobacteria bacterium]|nr:ABC transporter ATP-binding protein [Deltaproteobacteria bacterium]